MLRLQVCCGESKTRFVQVIDYDPEKILQDLVGKILTVVTETEMACYPVTWAFGHFTLRFPC
jgi:hypothetical protein